MKTHSSWVKFVSKLKNSSENIFVLIDTRFGPKQEKDFEKLWDGPIFFNSFNSNQRGLMVLLRDALPVKNIIVENRIKGSFTRLSLQWGNSKILIKCVYAPNDDQPAIDSECENNSSRFFREVFDNSGDDEYDVVLMAGDFNVAPDPNKDTLGYLHVNNPNSRNFIERMKALCMLTDVFRHRNPDVRKYTFSKGQAKNHTKAR